MVDVRFWRRFQLSRRIFRSECSMKRIVQSEFLDKLPPGDPRAIRSRRDLRRVNGWMRHHDIMAEALDKTFHSHPPGQITEIGAGDGTFLLCVAQKISPRWPDVNATLIDLQKNIALETFAAFASFGWHAEAVVADVFDWPHADGDIVVANLFLHHFDGARLAELLHMVSCRTKCFIAIEPHRGCW